jgi:large subunit ribosomal protein L22
MEAIAKTKYLKGSPRKARLVIDLIRGQNVSRALSILKFTDKRAALPIAKCLNSAIANATYTAEQQNIAIDPDDLWINTCFIDMGPTKGRRRMRPAPQGRAYREQRHYCHITIHVTSDTAARDEQALKYAAAKAIRDAAKKAVSGKEKAPAKAGKKANALKDVKIAEGVTVEEIETPVIEQAADVVVEAGSPSEVVEEIAATNDADVSAAIEASTSSEAEENETEPVDEVTKTKNEVLEGQ